MSITVNFPVKSGGYHAYWWNRQNNWSAVYNLASALHTTTSNIGAIYLCWAVWSNGRADIGRAGIIFDTQALPSGISLLSGKIKGTVRFATPGYFDGLTRVADIIRFVRAPALNTSVAIPSEFGYLRGCEIQVAGILITPAMTAPTYVEAALNAAGLASVVPGGYTIFGMRPGSDTPSSPSLGTYWCDDLSGALLELTYTTSTELLVETYPATDVTTTTATLNGAITQGAAIKRGFDWGVDAGSMTNQWYESGTYGVEAFSRPITGLTPGQGLCFRAKAAAD